MNNTADLSNPFIKNGSSYDGRILDSAYPYRDKIIIRSYPVLIGEALVITEITLEEELITSHQREWNVYYEIKGVPK